MKFSDILKKSFLENYNNVDISNIDIILAFLVTTLIAIYIYVIYRLVLRKTFYSKSFNISLVALSLITCAIILTIQFSVVVSLGMVGALSIVRFRTAIKEPMDLVFLFWSISIGIICGARLYLIAIILSFIVSIVIFTLEEMPCFHEVKVLVINTNKLDVHKEIESLIQKYVKHYKIKSYNISQNKINLLIELSGKNFDSLLEDLSSQEYIDSVSLIKQTGEITY